MVFPITVMLMILNFSCLFLPLPHRLTTKYLPACLADISSWMARYHLKLNFDKTELLLIRHRISQIPELPVTVDGTTVTAYHSARKLGVVLDEQLDKEQVTAKSQSCSFLLYNIKKI